MTIRPPVLAQAPKEYDRPFFDAVITELKAYFLRANQPYPNNMSTLNISIATLPTEAALATLRSGDVYRDTTAANVLKIKP